MVGKFKLSKTNINGYLFILPQMLLFLVFMIYPIFYGIILSFYKTRINKKVWHGLQNYIDLLKDEVFLKSVKNTLIFVVVVTILTIVCSLTISVAVQDKSSRYLNYIRCSYYMPVMLSMVVVSIIWAWMLRPADGVINYLITSLGFERMNFLGDKNLTLIVLIFMVLIPNTGQAVILYIANIISIPMDIIESASIDGANRWSKFIHITLPLVNPTTLYIVVMTMISTIKTFVVIQLMTNGGPYHASTTMMFLLYEKAFHFGELGSASAIGVIMFVIVFSLSIVQFRILRSKV